MESKISKAPRLVLYHSSYLFPLDLSELGIVIFVERRPNYKFSKVGHLYLWGSLVPRVVKQHFTPIATDPSALIMFAKSRPVVHASGQDATQVAT